MKWQSFIRAITLRTMSMAERSEAMNQHDARMGAAVVRRQSIVSRVATVTGLALLGLLLGLATPTAWAGTAVTSHASFAGNINFVTTGGTFRTSPNTNNPDSVTTTSSGTLSGIPAGSTIVAAYLYYAASGTTADANVTFNNIAVVADRTFTDTTVSPFYSGFEDVTATVTSTGNGTYTMKNLAISTGNTWTGNQTVLGGWALVVIYSNDTTETNRVINVFDGFQAFQNSSITLTPNNFKVPTTGINGKFAVITWEGDPGPAPLDTGETVAFNGTALSDACNGTGNQYNSTINTLSCTGNDTLDDKYYGVDIDTYNIGSQLGAGNTSATTFYQSGQDAVLLSAQIISVANVPVADLSISKSHTGNFTAGSNASYSIVVHNSGPGAATGTTTVTDTLPTGLSYASGSTGWTCSASGQTVTCTSTTTIAKDADLPLTLTVAVASNAPSSVNNVATVSTTAFELNTSNNTSNTDTATIVGSNLPASGNKVLYVYDNQTLTRTPQPASNSTGVIVNSGNNNNSNFKDWTLSPAIPSGRTLIIPSGTTITFQLSMACDDTCGRRDNSNATVELLNGTSLGTSASQSFNNTTPALKTFTITTGSATTVNVGGHLVLRVHATTQDLRLYQYYNGASKITFFTTTVINVDSVAMYSVPYTNSPNTTTKTAYNPGDIVYVRAVISDPFGSYDVNHATITLTDPSGVITTPSAMTQVADSGAATRTYEYAYTLPANAKAGSWKASVTGYEGTEGAVTHTDNATFSVVVLTPNLLVLKSVTAVSDPAEGTTNAKAMPGAVMQYQIIVTNDGNGPVDGNSLVITDPIPANTNFVKNSVVFIDGSTSSGLTSPIVKYSNNNGTSWVYTPPTGTGADPAVTNLQITPQGIMAAKTGTTAPFFSVTFQVIIQ